MVLQLHLSRLQYFSLLLLTAGFVLLLPQVTLHPTPYTLHPTPYLLLLTAGFVLLLPQVSGFGIAELGFRVQGSLRN